MHEESSNTAAITCIICLIFLMFAMTTNAVGVIMPLLVEEFGITLARAGSFHYVTMAAIAIGALFLGWLADRLGCRFVVIAGLALFAIASLLFPLAQNYWFILALLIASGVAIAIFKTGVLVLISRIATSVTSHTVIMNAVEGFFGIGSIIGPALVSLMLLRGTSWKWLYVCAAGISIAALALSTAVISRRGRESAGKAATLGTAFALLKDRYALGFSLAAFLYVTVECSVYVWMPLIIIARGENDLMAIYALVLFNVFRTLGRFVGAALLARFDWAMLLAISSFGVLLCFVVSMIGGVWPATMLLPISGFFMSIIYPTINSKGMCCFPIDRHGSIAGIILFFTCASATVGPLAINATSDGLGDEFYGFALATIFALLLFAVTLLNVFFKPAHQRLQECNAREYGGSVQHL